MRLPAVFYLAGLLCGLLQITPALPHPLLLAVACTALASHARRGCSTALLAGVAVGMYAVSGYRASTPPLAAQGTLVRVSGAVADFARPGAGGWRYEMVPGHTLDIAGHGYRAGRIVVRAHPGAVPPRPGDWCELWLRLRPLHGFANPGVTDRARGLAARGIVARASVVRHPANLCLPIAPHNSVAMLRRRLSGAIDAAVADERAAGVLRAIVVGDRGGVSDTDRAVMRATGTGHLLAISGLHVSLCAAAAFALSRIALALVAARRRQRAVIRSAWLVAALAAACYTLLAGSSVPALRAALMTACAAAAAWRGARVLSIDTLLAALVAVATLMPLSLLSEACWLSFTAVLILVVAAALRPATPAVLLAARTHVVLAVGLAPLTAYVFGVMTPIAPLANFVAVPWCALFVVPTALLGALMAAVSVHCASVLWMTSARLWQALSGLTGRLSELAPAVEVAGALGACAALALTAAVLLSLAPRAAGVRTLALLVALLQLAPGPTLSAGTLSLVAYDVGQGLSVLVRTRGRALLYDTGPRWRDGAGSAAASVVLPALAHAGVRHLDALVISHGDNDHAGGVADIRRHIPVARTWVPPGEPGYGDATACLRGGAWRWGEVRFRWLAPAAGDSGSRNDRSCVLAIESPYGRVLLAGDIERAAEARLLRRDGAGLRADVLLVPHHGSRTSSSAEFAAAVAPRVAIVSAGYGNRYGLPHATVVARYATAGAEVLNTADVGAVLVDIDSRGIRTRGVRHATPRFWHSRAPVANAGGILSSAGLVW